MSATALQRRRSPSTVFDADTLLAQVCRQTLTTRVDGILWTLTDGIASALVENEQ